MCQRHYIGIGNGPMNIKNNKDGGYKIMQKNKYDVPDMEIIQMEAEDVIKTSDGNELPSIPIG